MSCTSTPAPSRRWFTMGTGDGFDRRIGERCDVEGLEVAWITRHPGDAGGLLRRRAAHLVEQSARIVDVSITGAAVVAPASTHLHRGATALIRVDGREAVVRIERCTPTLRPKVMRYGVQFCSIDPELRERLTRLVDEGRRTRLAHDARR